MVIEKCLKFPRDLFNIIPGQPGKGSQCPVFIIFCINKILHQHKAYRRPDKA